jgi:tetratricopeptide (TPR) repeat protein
MRLLAAIIPAAAAALAFWPSLKGDFTLDDNLSVVENMTLRPEQPWTSVLTHDYWGIPMARSFHKSFRPLTTLTFRLNRALSPTAQSFHAVNLALHCIVACLFTWFASLVRLGVEPVPGPAVSHSQRFALIAGLIFAVHPAHVEAVANVTGRAEILSGFFSLLTLVLWTQARPSRWAIRAPAEIVGIIFALLCSAAAGLSKEPGILILGVCGAHDAWCLIFNNGDEWGLARAARGISQRGKSCGSRRDSVGRHSIRWRLLFRFFVAAAFGGIFCTLRVLAANGFQTHFTPSVNAASFVDDPITRVLSRARTAAVHFGILLLPTTLSCDWGHDAVPLVWRVDDARNLETLACFSFLAAHALVCCSPMASRGESLTRPMSYPIDDTTRIGTAELKHQAANKSVDARAGVSEPTNLQAISREPRSSSCVETGFASVTKNLHVEWAPVQTAARFGLLLLIVPFLPASGIFFRVGFTVAERILYVPSMGFALMVAAYFEAAARFTLDFKCEGAWGKKRAANSGDIVTPERGRKLLLIRALMLAALGWAIHRSRSRCVDWKNDEKLWVAAAEALPSNSRALTAAAGTLMREDVTRPSSARTARARIMRLQEADVLLRRAITLSPEAMEAWQKLGKLKADHLPAAMRQDEGLPTRVNEPLGRAGSTAKEWRAAARETRMNAEAESAWSRLVRVEPTVRFGGRWHWRYPNYNALWQGREDHSVAWSNLAWLAFSQKSSDKRGTGWAEAEDRFRRAVLANPERATWKATTLVPNLAAFLAATKDRDSSEQTLHRRRTEGDRLDAARRKMKAWIDEDMLALQRV